MLVHSQNSDLQHKLETLRKTSWWRSSWQCVCSCWFNLKLNLFQVSFCCLQQLCLLKSQEGALWSWTCVYQCRARVTSAGLTGMFRNWNSLLRSGEHHRGWGSCLYLIPLLPVRLWHTFTFTLALLQSGVFFFPAALWLCLGTLPRVFYCLSLCVSYLTQLT